jgi:hypothetical protein
MGVSDHMIRKRVLGLVHLLGRGLRDKAEMRHDERLHYLIIHQLGTLFIHVVSDAR